jgi:2'-5' RNA ligase
VSRSGPGGGRGAGEGGATLRLFVALDLPDDARRAVAAWQELVFGDLPDLRINRSLHLTLAFLGGTPASAVPELEAALAAEPLAAMPVMPGTPLFLPERGRQRVVALPLVAAPQAPDGLPALLDLQRRVSAALAGTGCYTPERRPYLPHVTVARFRRPGQPFSLQNVNLTELCLSRLVLYTSDLTSGAAVHTPLVTFPAR